LSFRYIPTATMGAPFLAQPHRAKGGKARTVESRHASSSIPQALKLLVSVQSAERPFRQPRYYDFNAQSEAKALRNCAICIAIQ
ncbi:MAG: hypothetical protein P4L50_21315, partial [Anaerolineaceae bacterium]|nr:hypothetical protein [Anaerolineaceae bacterium]